MTISSRTVIFDEYGHFMAAQFQEGYLSQALRAIEGIPNADYVVSGTRVFVFKKLVKLVKDAGLDASKDQPGIVDLSAQAWVCPDEAVRVWGVLPAGYEIQELDSQKGWQIFHEPFQAIVPCSFPTKHAAMGAIAQILMGRAVGEGGNLCCLGQPLTASRSVLPELPQMPELPQIEITATSRSRVLSDDGWLPGHAMIERSTYEECLRAEEQWGNHLGKIDAYVQKHLEELKGLISNQPALTHPPFPYMLDPDECDEAKELEALYPELSKTPSSWIWHHFGDFCQTLGFRRVVVMRDDRFLLFALGKLEDKSCGDYVAEEIGSSIAYFILNGAPPELASTQARAMRAFSAALKDRAQYIHRPMRYLEAERNRSLSSQAMDLGRPVLKAGKPITTLQDYLHNGRKYSVRTVAV